jgi:hypothetical protein
MLFLVLLQQSLTSLSGTCLQETLYMRLEGRIPPVCTSEHHAGGTVLPQMAVQYCSFQGSVSLQMLDTLDGLSGYKILLTCSQQIMRRLIQSSARAAKPDEHRLLSAQGNVDAHYYINILSSGLPLNSELMCTKTA